MAGYLFRRPTDRRLAPWQPTLVSRQPFSAPDAPPAGRQVVSQPNELHRPRRAGVAAYRLLNHIPPAESLPPGQFARLYARLAAPPRTATAAYWQGRGVPPGEAAIPGRVVIALPASLFVARRAARSAFDWINHVPPDLNDPPQLPAGRPLFPARAPGRDWAAYCAYEIGGGTVAWFAFGARLPGCPYRPDREEEDSTLASRPAEGESYRGREAEPTPTLATKPVTVVSYPGRRLSTDTPPSRPNKCC